MSSSIYGGLFGRAWKEGCYVRTSCFRTRAAGAALAAGAPREINAKSIHLTNVPEGEAWYATTAGSSNNSLLDRHDLRPGLASVAAGAAGEGRVVFMGDVNMRCSWDASSCVASSPAMQWKAAPVARTASASDTPGCACRGRCTACTCLSSQRG